MSNIEELATQYLISKQELKAAQSKAKHYKELLGGILLDGQLVSVGGRVMRWKVSVGASPAYKKALDWVHGKVDPTTQMLLEEAVGLTSGTRVTMDLVEGE